MAVCGGSGKLEKVTSKGDGPSAACPQTYPKQEPEVRNQLIGNAQKLLHEHKGQSRGTGGLFFKVVHYKTFLQNPAWGGKDYRWVGSRP
jgi:hypothetical protein